MNQETEPTESFLSWQGKISGPHSQKDIQQLLKVGKIHSLYKIQVRGEWILLRDFLAEQDQKARELTKKRAEKPQAEQPPTPPPILSHDSIPHAIVIPEDDFTQDATPSAHMDPLPDDGNDGSGESKGMAIASFVLSCLFFIPFLNLLTWLMGLIFGHLACSQADLRSKSTTATLTWVGLWLSYVELGFFLIGLAYFLMIDAPYMEAAFFLLHWQMVGIALGALIGAGILMLAVKLAAGVLIRFPVCFVGALLPTAVSNFATLIVRGSLTSSELTSSKGLGMLGLAYLILFVGQLFFWARFIRLPNDSELGHVNAALVSLIYTVIFIFIGIGYFALLTVLTS